MRGFYALCMMLMLSTQIFSQTAPAPPELKNALDSFSYALGLSISNFYKEQGVKEINENLVLKAITDVKNGTVRLTDDAVNTAIMNYLDELKSKERSEEHTSELQSRENLV